MTSAMSIPCPAKRAPLLPPVWVMPLPELEPDPLAPLLPLLALLVAVKGLLSELMVARVRSTVNCAKPS